MIPAMVFQYPTDRNPFLVQGWGSTWVDGEEGHVRTGVTFELGFDGCSFPYPGWHAPLQWHPGWSCSVWNVLLWQFRQDTLDWVRRTVHGGREPGPQSMLCYSLTMWLSWSLQLFWAMFSSSLKWNSNKIYLSRVLWELNNKLANRVL